MGAAPRGARGRRARGRGTGLRRTRLERAGARAPADEALRTRALESDRYPTAAFALTRPLRLTSRPTAVGRLRLHGVTRPVRVRLRARSSAAGVDIAGAAAIRFGDFRMRPPSVAGFVSVEDRGLMEVRLRLR